ncbi:MAG: hypothetical protein JSS66_02740 [Armatimonadetes bacterium]|nr:hypothetical protein [Armatimonadota bacterium]
MRRTVLLLALLPAIAFGQHFEMKWTEVVSLNDAVLPPVWPIDSPNLLTVGLSLDMAHVVTPFTPALNDSLTATMIVPVEPEELQTPGYVVTPFESSTAMQPQDSGYRPGYAPDTGPGYGAPPVIGQDNLQAWGYSPFRDGR